MAGITLVLYRPATTFYGGGGSASIVPSVFPVAIAGRAYNIDVALYERETIDSRRQGFDTEGEPGEQSLSVDGVWRKSCTHWELGAGQTHLDEVDSVPLRYRSSKGIDPWTVRTLRLHRDTDQKRASANDNLQLLPIGTTHLYLADGDDVYWTADPVASPATWTAANIEAGGTPGTVQSITADGNRVYAALGGEGIHHTAVGAATSTAFSAYQANLVGYANGRLLAADGPELAEIDAGGVAVTLMTHLNADFEWTTIVSAPHGIYAAGNGGDHGEFYFIGYDPATGELAPPVPAGELPVGEYIRTMRFYGDLLLLGTSDGFRLAEIAGEFGVSPGAVNLAPGDVRALAVHGEFAWCSWSNFDGVSTGLGRAKLSRFTEPLVPAYASDLMVTGQGAVISAASFNDRRYLAVSALGVYGEHEDDELVPSGTIDSGLLRFRTAEKKVASSIGLRHDPLAGRVEVAILAEDGNVHNAGFSDVQGSIGPSSLLAGGNVSGESLETRVVLLRSATAPAQGPVLHRWTLRAHVVPLLTDAILVPLLVHTQVDNMVGEGRKVPFDPLAEFMFLKGLEASRSPVIYQEGNLTQRVVVDKVRVKPKKWIHPSHDWFEGHIFVRLLTVQPVSGN